MTDVRFWATPGGALEAGESLEGAARRELIEELQLSGVTLSQPVWKRRHRFTGMAETSTNMSYTSSLVCPLPSRSIRFVLRDPRATTS